MKNYLKSIKLLFLLLSLSFIISCNNDDDNNMEVNNQIDFLGIWQGSFKHSGHPDGLDFTVDIKQQLIINDGNAPGDYFIGKIYFSNTTTSCCGQENDGQITAQFTEDGRLSNLVIQQSSIINNTNCIGTYAGTGLFTINSITINFIGTDCLGTYSGGEIQLTKLN